MVLQRSLQQYSRYFLKNIYGFRNLFLGPFSSNDMAEWFEAGYFKKDLLIRRSCDQEFLSLGQVETRYGSNPFRSTRHPPAFLTPPPPASTTISRPPGMGALAPPTQPSPVQPVTTTTTPSTVGGGWAAAPTQPAAPQQPTLTRAPQPVAPAPAPQPVMRTLSPIEQVIQLIQSSLEHQSVFKQLMQQITQLEQYAGLPHSHQESLGLLIKGSGSADLIF